MFDEIQSFNLINLFVLSIFLIGRCCSITQVLRTENLLQLKMYLSKT